ncbi:uncharacterized protein LOC124635936 [Helicoverpa zea]|uniref:uncharacterized protein LOC124635936 n=1 Tax=Helicoverpa zea TaxID=7113 RepID=UPI001F5ACD2C|nr:uncharacterized protein LOC124635936 [Helicoverpa zea]
MESRRDIRTTAENETERRISKNPRFNLHLVQKATEPSDRPMIDCTKFERLSFYRSYTSSPIKIELVVLSHLVLNDYIWFYVLNLFLKSLPHSFLHFFMASYAPEEHIFLTKMVPVCHGFKYLLVVAAFFELLLYSNSVIQLFHFSLDGLASKNPWNRAVYSADVDLIAESISAPPVVHILTARSTQEPTLLLSQPGLGPSMAEFMADYHINKALITVVESVFLYLLYPLGRLVDDYTFHYGTPPTRLRILNLRLVPVYYAFKYYFMMNATYDVLSQPEVKIKIPYFVWSWPIMAVPLFLGVLWIIYKYLTWQYIFRPIPKWGPRDFSERQLRKQYSSKYYISSEVPKLLSRYLMSKRESKVYKVDVRYDMQRRSTVSKAVGFSAPSKKNM